MQKRMKKIKEIITKIKNYINWGCCNLEEIFTENDMYDMFSDYDNDITKL